MNVEVLDNTVVALDNGNCPANVKLGVASYTAQAAITHSEARTINRLKAKLVKLLRGDKVQYAYIDAKKRYDIETDLTIVRLTMTEAMEDG